MPAATPSNTFAAVETLNPDGAGDVVLLCEHASNAIPGPFNGLGLSPAERRSHIAWDPGALGLAAHLSRRLDAPLIAGTVSRLVYDCNRPPTAEAAVAARSETIDIPGNQGLSDTERAERAALVYRPYCAEVDRILDAREAAGQGSVLVTIHSFTPTYFGRRRAVQIGILHDTDSRIADAMLDNAWVLPHRIVRRNEPYGPADGVTHSLRIHAIARALPNVMIEVRNDLLACPEDEAALAGEVLHLLRPALREIGQSAKEAPHA